MTNSRSARNQKAVLEKLELDCLSPEALNRATDLAMEYLNKQQSSEPPTPPQNAAALSEIDAREGDIREQFKAGKLPPSVFRTWLAEFAREREALTQRTTTSQNSARITRADFLQEYKSAVTRKLKIFTARENVAQSREALRTVLAEGRLILRPDVANARFEGSLVLSHGMSSRKKLATMSKREGLRCVHRKYDPGRERSSGEIGATGAETRQGLHLRCLETGNLVIARL